MNPQCRLGKEGRCCLWVGLAQQEIGGLGGVKGAQAQLLNSHLGPLCQLLPLVSCLALVLGVHLLNLLLNLGFICIRSVSPAPDLGSISGTLPDVWSLLSETDLPETAACQGSLHATEMR